LDSSPIEIPPESLSRSGSTSERTFQRSPSVPSITQIQDKTARKSASMDEVNKILFINSIDKIKKNFLLQNKAI
jgi:hypothetical protein